MKIEAIVKRINHIYLLCLTAGICGIGQSVITSISAHRFTGISLLPLVMIAMGAVFLRAFKTESAEDAMNIINVLKSFALILAAYATYSLIWYFASTWGISFSMFGFWIQIVSNFTAIIASLSVLFTAVTMKPGDIKKFKLASGILLIIELFVVFTVTVSALLVSEMLLPVIMLLILFAFMFTAVPKLQGNRIVRGALIGGIIAGEAGAVVGAIVASNKEGMK